MTQSEMNFVNNIALIYTSDRNWLNHMSQLLRQVGFADGRSFAGTPASLNAYRRGPVPFVFLHSSTPNDEVMRVLDIIRGHAEVHLRFVPVVMVAERGRVNDVLDFIQMGFDDIVLEPVTAATLTQRMALQLGRELDYYQTDNYFGPDRRRFRKTGGPGSRRHQAGDYFYRHFVIKRNAAHGTQIVSTRTHFPRAEAI